MADEVKSVLRKEVLNLRRVVKGSKLGKHISENILIPILQKIDPVIDELLDWIGWYISEEIRYVLETARPGHIWTYKVYYVDPSAPSGQKYTEIGEYTPSAQGSAPFSPAGGGSDPDIPPSGNLYRSINYTIKDGSVILGIEDNRTSYHLWFRWGKLFVGDTMQGRSASDYGAIIDDPTSGSRYRPYFTSTIKKMKPKIKKRFREEFRKTVHGATKRPTVKRAIEIHFRWEKQS